MLVQLITSNSVRRNSEKFFQSSTADYNRHKQWSIGIISNQLVFRGADPDLNEWKLLHLLQSNYYRHYVSFPHSLINAIHAEDIKYSNA